MIKFGGINEMYRVELNKHGDPDALRLMEIPKPHPTAGQVRVKVRSAGINPVNIKVRDS